ncbi:MAG: divergent polysaccharide deacetylase family protein [Methyloligellaceae bacterium]
MAERGLKTLMKALQATATAIFAGLMLAIAWFALRPDPLGGEPFADLQIPTERPQFAPPSSRTLRHADLADGSRQTDRERKLSTPGGLGDGTPAASNSNTKDRPKAGGSQTNYPGVKVVGLGKRPTANGNATRGRALPAPIAENAVAGPATMSSVPVKALVEYTRYGPLPKMSEDGRAPKFVYARPHKPSSRSAQGQPAQIAILLSGLGLSSVSTHTAVNKLPGAVTLAFEPYGSNLQGWIRKARQRGHEVVLQLPLEPFDYPDNDPGPHTLLTSLPPEESLKRLKWLMARFTGYIGVTNTAGAKFTAAKEALRPILRELKIRGLVYIDDGVSPRSNASRLAREFDMSFISGQVIIDAEKTRSDIKAALAKLETIAQEQGLAIGVGSNLPITLAEISEWAEKLAEKGIVLIPISAAIRLNRPVNRS